MLEAKWPERIDATCFAMAFLVLVLCASARTIIIACKGAFTSSQFSSILLRLYYIYEKSPKKSRDLACIVDDLKQVYNFSIGGDLPIRSCGMRWITHTTACARSLCAYIAHLSTLVEDKSIMIVLV